MKNYPPEDTKFRAAAKNLKISTSSVSLARFLKLFVRASISGVTFQAANELIRRKYST
jgi:hypothetical protein